MPQVEVNGQEMFIPQSGMEQFTKDYPEANIHYTIGNEVLSIPFKNAQSFLKDYPTAKTIENSDFMPGGKMSLVQPSPSTPSAPLRDQTNFLSNKAGDNADGVDNKITEADKMRLGSFPVQAPTLNLEDKPAGQFYKPLPRQTSLYNPRLRENDMTGLTEEKTADARPALQKEFIAPTGEGIKQGHGAQAEASTQSAEYLANPQEQAKAQWELLQNTPQKYGTPRKDQFGNVSWDLTADDQEYMNSLFDQLPERQQVEEWKKNPEKWNDRPFIQQFRTVADSQKSIFGDNWVGDTSLAAGNVVERLNAGLSGVFAGSSELMHQWVEKPLYGWMAEPNSRMIWGNIADYFAADQEYSHSAGGTHNTMDENGQIRQKDFTDYYKEGDILGMLGDLTLGGIESAPNSLAVAGTAALGMPQVGGAIVFTNVAGNKKRELDKYNPELSELQKTAISAGYGIVERYSEMLGDIPLGKMLAKIYKVGGAEAASHVMRNSVESILNQTTKNLKNASLLIKAPLTEYAEGIASNVGGDLIDAAAGIKDFDIKRTISDAATNSVYDLVAGGGFGLVGTPGLIRNAKVAKQLQTLKSQYDAANSNMQNAFADSEFEFDGEKIITLPLAQQQEILPAVYDAENLSDEQKTAIRDYMEAGNKLNAALVNVGLTNIELLRKKANAFKQVQESINDKTGKLDVITIQGTADTQQYNVKSGTVVLDNEGKVDTQNSDEAIYYYTGAMNEDGTPEVNIITPESISELTQLDPKEELKSRFTEIEAEEFVRSEFGEGMQIQVNTDAGLLPATVVAVTPTGLVANVQGQEVELSFAQAVEDVTSTSLSNQTSTSLRDQENIPATEGQQATTYAPGTSVVVNGTTFVVGEQDEEGNYFINDENGQQIDRFTPEEMAEMGFSAAVTPTEAEQISTTDNRQQTAEETTPAQTQYPINAKTGEVDFSQFTPEHHYQYAVETEGEAVAQQDLRNAIKDQFNIITKHKKKIDSANFEKKAPLRAQLKPMQEKLDVLNALAEKYIPQAQPKPVVKRTTAEGTASATIQERWENAPKTVGFDDTLTLPNGEIINGRWVLSTAFAPTPSHNPETYQSSEGFPTTPEGKNVNDNDYTNKRAEVETKAADYDSRAIDDPIVVSGGVVVSGNNRTMSGQIAAKNGTDTKYLEALKTKAKKYGFTTEQVEATENPRIYFEVIDQLPLNVDTFAKFNARTSKSKSATEKAIVATKRNDAELTGKIMATIERFDSLADFYTSEKAQTEVLKYLLESGVINQNEVPELFENNNFTTNGRNYLEAVIIGNVMQEEQIKVLNMDGMKQYRAKIVRAIVPLLQNSKLAESMISELNTAILYLYESGGNLMDYFSQQNMFAENNFDKDAVLLSIALQRTETNFKKFVADTNNALKDQTIDIFLGRTKTKDDVYEQFRETLNDTERATISNAERNGQPATNLRSAENSSNAAKPDTGGATANGSNIREKLTPAQLDTQELDAEIAAQDHNNNPTEKQKETGIYNKARISLQGHNITLETLKGQQRSGTDSNGKAWSITMNNHYGELDGTTGYDGDAIDVFVGPNPKSGQIFVIDQISNDGTFDESKVMLGFDTAEEAKAAYMSNYEEGWQGFGSITPAGDNFKQWLYDGKKQRKPYAEYKDTPEAVEMSDKIEPTFEIMSISEKLVNKQPLTTEEQSVYKNADNKRMFNEAVGRIIAAKDEEDEKKQQAKKKAKKSKPKTTTPQSQIQQVLDNYNDAENMTMNDVISDILTIAYDNNISEIQEAYKTYENELREDREEFGERGDREAIENNFMQLVNDYLNQSEQPLDAEYKETPEAVEKVDSNVDTSKANVDTPESIKTKLLSELTLPKYIYDFFNSLKQSESSDYIFAVYGKGFAPFNGRKINEFFSYVRNAINNNDKIAKEILQDKGFDISNVEKVDYTRIWFKNGIFLSKTTGEKNSNANYFYAGTQVSIRDTKEYREIADQFVDNNEMIEKPVEAKVELSDVDKYNGKTVYRKGLAYKIDVIPESERNNEPVIKYNKKEKSKYPAIRITGVGHDFNAVGWIDEQFKNEYLLEQPEAPKYKNGDTVTYKGKQYIVNGIYADNKEVDLEDEKGNLMHEEVPVSELNQSEQPTEKQSSGNKLPEQDLSVLNDAKTQLDNALKTINAKDLDKAKGGVGISAMYFARKFVKTPDTNKPLYDAIYNYYFDTVSNYSIQQKAPQKQPWEMTREEWNKNVFIIPVRVGYGKSGTAKSGDINVQINNSQSDKPITDINKAAQRIINDNPIIEVDKATVVRQLLDAYKFQKRGIKELVNGNVRVILHDGETTPNTTATNHKLAIQQAISEGKQVPENVLADYPELKKAEESPELPKGFRYLTEDEAKKLYHHTGEKALANDLYSNFSDVSRAQNRYEEYGLKKNITIQGREVEATLWYDGKNNDQPRLSYQYTDSKGNVVKQTLLLSGKKVLNGGGFQFNKVNVKSDIIEANPKETVNEEKQISEKVSAGQANQPLSVEEQEIVDTDSKIQNIVEQPKITATDEKIEDVGQKIGGAKKDLFQEYAKKLLSVTDQDIARLPLSKSFPRPNFAQLIEDGKMTQETAIFLNYFYDNIPSKPQKSYKVERWVKTVREALDTFNSVLESKPTRDLMQEYIDMLNTNIVGQRKAFNAEVYRAVRKAINFPNNEVNVGNLTILRSQTGENAYVYSVGNPIGNRVKLTGRFNTMEEAAAKLIEMAKETAGKPKQVEFSVYSSRSRGDFYITPKGKSEIVLQNGFKTSKEAFEYINENREALTDRFNAMKEIPSERRMSNKERVGFDYRQGKNVTAEDFGKEFGFRGVEFGNWVNQEERQAHINEAYDALMDLASVIGVTPRALSLNGELGFAFGSRGGGKYAAHYETDKVVINLTKTKGAGTLAHEWFHALDNYLLRAVGNRTSYATDGPGFNKEGKPALRPELNDAFRNLMKVIRKSGFYTRSAKLDIVKGSKYWGTSVELGARGFEDFVMNKLAKSNIQNDYLVNFKSLAEFIDRVNGDISEITSKYPYPTMEESEAISEAYQNLFDTIQEDDNGVLFQAVSPIGFYSTVEKALEAIQQERGTKEQFKQMLLKNGAKQAEMDWMGFDELPEKLTKSDIQNWIDENRIEVKEVTKGGANLTYEQWIERNPEMLNLTEDEIDNAYDIASNEGSGATKYSQYVIPGGSNYKELLLTMPEKRVNVTYSLIDDNVRYGGNYKVKNNVTGEEILGSFKTKEAAEKWIQGQSGSRYSTKDNFKSAHFDEPNILAHVRFDERTVNGERVLFIQEFQSDWAQKGKKEGFKGDTNYDAVLERENVWDVGGIKVLYFERGVDGKNYRTINKNREQVWFKTLDDAVKQANETVSNTSEKEIFKVPSMPFRKTDQWVNLAARRMIRYAAENGFDRIAWTNGEQQADRYDLSKSIKEIEYSINPFVVSQKDNLPMYQLKARDKNDNPVIKGEYAENELENIVGKELAKKIVNGEGKETVDKTKSLTGLDLKVGGEGMKAFYDAIVPSAMSKLGKPFGAKVENIDLSQPRGERSDYEDLGAWEDAYEGTTSTQQSIPVTDSMKQTAMAGMPLYHTGTTMQPTTPEEVAATVEQLLKTGLAKEVRMVTPEEIQKEIDGTEQKQISNDEIKAKQFGIISKYNPAPNNYNTWIRSKEEIKTAEEAFKAAFEDGNMYPDFTVEDMKKAIEKGEVTIYSSKPIKQGNFVTPSLMNAQDYAGGSKVYSKTVNITDIAWIDESEGQYTPVQFMRTPTGTIYGFVKKGIVYINSNTPNLNTPIHEFGHLWIDAIEGSELYNRGAELVKETPYWERVNADPNYSHLSENARAKEAMAMAIGDKGEAVKRNIGLFARIKVWIADVWTRIGSKFGIQNLTPEQIQNLTFNDFVEVAVSELLTPSPSGIPLKKGKGGAIPATIDVDGVQRPTTNSTGKPIHSTEEGIRNFWRWFGDSKVTDEQGRPLVVYHGSNVDFNIFKSVSDRYFFTNNKTVAEKYRNDYVFKEDNSIGINSDEYSKFENDVIKNDNQVKEVYLKIENPKTKDYLGANWLENPIENDIDKNKDGLIAENIIDGASIKATTFIVFSPTQIKSATGNDGSFDPNEPDIRFQVGPEKPEFKGDLGEYAIQVVEYNEQQAERTERISKMQRLQEIMVAKSTLAARHRKGEVNNQEYAKQMLALHEERQRVMKGLPDPDPTDEGPDDSDPKPTRTIGQSIAEYATAVADWNYRQTIAKALDKTASSITGGLPPVDDDTDISGDMIRAELDQRLGGFFGRMAEGWQDNIRSVRIFLDLLREKGTKVSDFNNFYMQYTAIQGKNDAHLKDFGKRFMEAINANVLNIQKYTNYEYRDVENYVFLKHGIERNEYMRAQAAAEAVNEKLPPLTKEQIEGDIDGSLQDEYKAAYDQFMEEETAKVADKDYSGLFAVAAEIWAKQNGEAFNPKKKGDVARIQKMDEFKAERDAVIVEYIAEFEKTIADTIIPTNKKGEQLTIEGFWAAINSATNYSLDRLVSSGIESKEDVDDLKARYQYYVPLRGHEVEAEKIWQYEAPDNKNVVSKAIMQARGRGSRAEHPFAYIIQMAQTSINKANRNQLNQTILRLARLDKSGLMSVSETWYVLTGTDPDTGKEIWTETEPDFSEDHEIRVGEIRAWNEKMTKLEEEGKARRFRKGLRIGGLFIKPKQKRQHAITIFEDGISYQVYINGNPRVSQAINELNEKRTEIPIIPQLTRFCASMMTSRSPQFMLTNGARDLAFASSILPSKEGARYTGQFLKNYPVAMAILANNATFDFGNDKARYKKYLKEFEMNGGETGYTHLLELQDIQKDLYKKQKGKNYLNPKTDIDAIISIIDGGNKVIENSTRLATYITSRENGRSIERSVSDSKEVTLNFNRRGSGIMGASFVKSFFMFVNAGVQALANFGHVYKMHPAKMSATIGTYAAVGFLMPMIINMIGGDDDEKEYMNMTDWERQTNLCIPTGNGVAKIPLPQEMRVFFKLGDEVYKLYSGRTEASETAMATLLSAVDMIPISPLGTIAAGEVDDFGDLQRAISPDALRSVAEIATNTNFMGGQIYDKYKAEKEGLPGYQKARLNRVGEPRAPESIVAFTKWLDHLTGGDGVEKGRISWNPDIVNHIAKSYLNGVYGIISEGGKSFTKRFYTSNADIEEKNTTVRDYYKRIREAEEVLRQDKGYWEQVEKGEISEDTYNKAIPPALLEKAYTIHDYGNTITKIERLLKTGDLTPDDELYYKHMSDSLKQEVIRIK